MTRPTTQLFQYRVEVAQAMSVLVDWSDVQVMHVLTNADSVLSMAMERRRPPASTATVLLLDHLLARNPEPPAPPSTPLNAVRAAALRLVPMIRGVVRIDADVPEGLAMPATELPAHNLRPVSTGPVQLS